MPGILTLTALHMFIAVAGGYVLGMSVFGVGFSSSEAVKNTYSILVYAWQVLNAPAGLYALHAQAPDWRLFGVLQVMTSFLWANVVAIVISHGKA